MTSYKDERQGQLEFLENYGVPYNDDGAILIGDTDGIYNGILFEFKLSNINPNSTVFQAVKYLSKLRISGHNVPATIICVSLDTKTAYVYKSENYRDDINKVYVGASSKNNQGFIAGSPVEEYKYSNQLDSSKLKKLINRNKTVDEKYFAVDIDENCIVGWAERYYKEIPTAGKGDFIGDDSDLKVKLKGEIREPRHFKGLIKSYTKSTNEKFKYLMDCLNDRLHKKSLGAFYTPELYAELACKQLVLQAVNEVPEGNDYIILDRCAGTGNLEACLKGLVDRNGDDLLSHCVISTYEYYEYKVLLERLGQDVRDLLPPTEMDVIYENGIIRNANALDQEFVENPIIQQYVNNPKCSIIMFENVPYHNSSASTFTEEKGGCKKKKSSRTETFIGQEFKSRGLPLCNVKSTAHNELANLFIWSAFEYYLQNKGDKYIVFSPVYYFKTLGLVKKKPVDGFICNRKHFHATDNAISCLLWDPFSEDDYSDVFLPAYNIIENELVKSKDVCIKRATTSIGVYNDRRKDNKDVLNGVVCDSKGNCLVETKKGKKAKYNENIIGYIVHKGFTFDAQSKFLMRVPYSVELDKSTGYYLRKDNYLEKIPVFVSKIFPQQYWWEKGIYCTTADKGLAYLEDNNFLLDCLLYCCLCLENKCVSFTGSDNRLYMNELCLDNISYYTPLALNYIKSQKLDKAEQELIDTYNVVLNSIIDHPLYNPQITYGTYQINKDLNTKHVERIGRKDVKVPDYPILNGNIETLKDVLKKFYVTNLKDKMLKYELVK